MVLLIAGTDSNGNSNSERGKCRLHWTVMVLMGRISFGKCFDITRALYAQEWGRRKRRQELLLLFCPGTGRRMVPGRECLATHIKMIYTLTQRDKRNKRKVIPKCIRDNSYRKSVIDVSGEHRKSEVEKKQKDREERNCDGDKSLSEIQCCARVFRCPYCIEVDIHICLEARSKE